MNISNELLNALLKSLSNRRERELSKTRMKRDTKKSCSCKCEPRCCTLPSIDTDVEDCSSIHSDCTGENCREHERVVEFNADFNLDTIH